MCQYCFNWPAWPINQDTPEPKPELIAEPIRELEAAPEGLISEDKAFEVPEVITVTCRGMCADWLEGGTNEDAPKSEPSKNA
jgi:hypothetical protein